MKINWGTGITIFYCFFVTAMVYMVYLSTTVERSLVVENYYEKDLTYQSHLNAIKNSNALTTNLQINQNQEEQLILFQFPEEMKNIDGEIHFYRPSNNHQDIKLKVSPNSNNQQIFSTKEMQEGKWKVKVNWNGNDMPFYFEKLIIISSKKKTW